MTAKRGFSLLMLLVLLGSILVPQAAFAANHTVNATVESNQLKVTLTMDASGSAPVNATVKADGQGISGGSSTQSEALAPGASQTFAFNLSGGNVYGQYTYAVSFDDGSSASSGSIYHNAKLEITADPAVSGSTLTVPVVSNVGGAPVQVSINGIDAGAAQASQDGNYTLSIPLSGQMSNAGDYTITVRYPDQHLYGKATSSRSITIGSAAYSAIAIGTITAGENSMTVPGTAQAGQRVTITLVNAADSSKTYSAKEMAQDPSGAFTHTFNGIDAATYNVSVSYTNDTTGTAPTGSQQGVVVAAGYGVKSLSATGGQGTVSVTGALNWIPSPAIEVSLSVGGITQTATTDANGGFTATLNNVPAGNYTSVQVTSGSTLNKTVNVAGFRVWTASGSSEDILIQSVSSPANSNKIVITGTAAAGKTLSASFGTYTANATSDATTGAFTFEVTGVAAGTYSNFLVSYVGYAGGNPDTWTGSVTVGDDDTTASPITISWFGKYSDTKLAMNVTFEAGKTIKVALNGGSVQQYSDASQNVGYTSFAFPITKPTATTTYTVTAEYVGSPAMQVSRTFTYEISDTPDTITFGSVSADSNSIRVSGTAEAGKSIALSLSGPSSASETIAVTDGTVYKLYTGLPEGSYTIKADYTDGSGIGATASAIVSAPGSPILQVDLITNATTMVTGKTLAGLKATVRTTFGTTAFTASATADTTGVFRIPLTQAPAVGQYVYVDIVDASNATHTFTYQAIQDPGTTYRNLQLYSSGSDVLALQQRLKDLGYDVAVTGYYDTITQSAVRSFQYINGLGMDGIAGRETQVALYSVSARPYTTTGATYARLQRGDRSTLVSQLQTRLAELGYYSIRIDGIYGVATQAGVRAFQINNGLSGTGIADDVTQQVLFSSTAKPVGSTPSVYINLPRGSRGTEVRNLQTRLAYLGYYYGLIDGIYGSQTEAAVRKFQSKNNLAATGRADTATQTVLFSNNAWSTSGGGSSSSGSGSSSSGYVYLYWGCENEAVKRLQTALKSLGYYSGKIDGQYYNQTYNAVRAFQKANGLAVDGIAGRKTQNKLYGTNY